MTLHDRETNKLIADLIFGWYESLICPMEKTLHLSGENRATLIAKKKQISNLASEIFIKDFDGFKLMQEKDARKIELYLKKSVEESIKKIQSNS